MPSLICPGATYRPQPGGVTLDTSLPPRSVWHITWDALRADGSQPAFGAVGLYLETMQYCPNIMWNPFTGEILQYYPANVGGRALKYNNQDGRVCIQVEVFFSPGCVVDGRKYNTVADTPLKGFGTLVSWMETWGVPRRWPMGSPQWQGNSRDVGIWNGNAGHYGHCNSPGDTHTDPGPMPALDSINSSGSVEKDEFDMTTTREVVDAIFSKRFPRGGGVGGETDLGGAVAWLDANFAGVASRVAAQDATIKNLVGAVAALAKGETFDEAKLLAGVEAAAAAGVKAAITSIDTTVTIAKE